MRLLHRLRDWGDRHKELNRESIELQQKKLDLKKEKENITKVMTANVEKPTVVNAMAERLEALEEELMAITVVSADTDVEAYEAETVINYCVHYIQNVSELWQNAAVEQQYCFQSLIFPDKLP